MKEKLANDKKAKDLLFKFLSVLIIATAALIAYSVLTNDTDGRKQIVDGDGGTEYIEETGTETTTANSQEQRLSQILSQIKGVGKVEVMITYEEKEAEQAMFSGSQSSQAQAVKGVIVAAEGAGNPVIKSDIISAITSAFGIPAGNVMVFEKEQ